MSSTGKSFLKKKKPVEPITTPKQGPRQEPKHSTPKQDMIVDVEKPDVTPIEDQEGGSKQRARTGNKKDVSCLLLILNGLLSFEVFMNNFVFILGLFLCI